jgi:deferrochelatase/peroxidase EfeB
MREAGFGENRALIRRGFPFRQEREEGLAFVGLAAHPESHARALDAMLGLGFPGAERLLAYAHPISGGLYVTPSCEWFTPSST